MAVNSLEGDCCLEVGVGSRNPLFVEGVSGLH